MTRSRAEIPEATVWVDVDATDLWALRQSMAADAALPSDRPPSLTAMIARYVVSALEQYPVLASRLSADGTALEYLDGIHLGVAADTERGLLVPVVRHAEGMSIGELDAAIRTVAEAARSGSASPEQLTGSTFTLNNYGSLGVDGSAAIINHPEVAILGIGRMIERPWVVDGAIVPRRITQRVAGVRPPGVRRRLRGGLPARGRRRDRAPDAALSASSSRSARMFAASEGVQPPTVGANGHARRWFSPAP